MPIYSNPPNMPQFGMFDPRARHNSLPRSSDSYFIITDSGTAKIVATDTEQYDGPYEAFPRFSEQEFETGEKFMHEDFTVHAIKYTEAPNDSGITVTIGG